jgi:hypothetical protein
MIETIAATLQAEIWAHDFDAPIRERLSACLPLLDEAIADWRANHSFSAPGLMIVAATAHSGVVLHANGWSDVECDRELAVRAVAEAVEMPVSAESGRIVTIALSVVLGETGRRAQARDAERISRFGDLPMLCVVVDPPALLATTVRVEVAAEPSRMVH